MDAVLGIGKAGCAIADVMAKYPQYEIFKIDVGLKKSKRNFPMPEQSTSQQYEESCPGFGSFFKSFKKDDNVMVVIGGGGAISGATLKILENIKHTKMTILYIKPDISLIGGKKFLYDDMTFHVLQEYARSGLFESICLVHNPTIEEILGGVPIDTFYDVINNLVTTTVHMINIYNNTDPYLKICRNQRFKIELQVLESSMLAVAKKDCSFRLTISKRRCTMWLQLRNRLRIITSLDS